MGRTVLGFPWHVDEVLVIDIHDRVLVDLRPLTQLSNAGVHRGHEVGELEFESGTSVVPHV